MDQGTEKWLFTSRWLLWLAPAGLRGGLKTGGVPPKPPATIFLCGPQCSGTSDRCSGRCGVIFLRAVAAAVSSSTSLRRLRLGVAAQASGTSLSDVSAIPDVAASRITRRRATAISTFFLHAGVRLRDQRLSHAGVRLRDQRLSHAGERLRDQRLSVHQSSPACHGQTAGITFQLLPCKRWEGCRVWHGMLQCSSTVWQFRWPSEVLASETEPDKAWELASRKECGLVSRRSCSVPKFL